MSRVAWWNVERFDELFANLSMDIIRESAKIVAANARTRCPGFPSTISRPVYRSGPYAGEPWTARDAGQLKRSIRTVELHAEKYGSTFFEERNVRVYAGHYLAFYARIVEYYTPFMRPALTASYGAIRGLISSGKKAA